jgi:hypothetical protein
MSKLGSTILSIVRFSLAVGLLVVVGHQSARAADEENGGCSAYFEGDYYCAAGETITANRYCVPGQSGGCETCTTSYYLDTCFSAGGKQHSGYTPTEPPQ